jgi:hypothetical protein
VDEQWAMDRSGSLQEPGCPEKTKKEILARLATIDRVECYRIIEAYSRMATGSLSNWSFLALNESRLRMESRLLEENQVFISTGLGGREDKLRYFMVLVTRSGHALDPTQKKVIFNEFDYTLKKYFAELEEIRFSEYMAAMLLLLPVIHSLKKVFLEAIAECNQYGDFLSEEFIVTNVKTLSFEEIKLYLERRRKQG